MYLYCTYYIHIYMYTYNATLHAICSMPSTTYYILCNRHPLEGLKSGVSINPGSFRYPEKTVRAHTRDPWDPMIPFKGLLWRGSRDIYIYIEAVLSYIGSILGFGLSYEPLLVVWALSFLKGL